MTNESDSYWWHTHQRRVRSWQRRQRELREALEAEHERNIARDPATRKTQRDAFLQGCRHVRRLFNLPANAVEASIDYREAEHRFPKVLHRRVPRVIRIAHGAIMPDVDVAWRYVNGDFEAQDVKRGYEPNVFAWVKRPTIPADWIEQLMQLKAEPTVEVSE